MIKRLSADFVKLIHSDYPELEQLNLAKNGELLSLISLCRTDLHRKFGHFRKYTDLTEPRPKQDPLPIQRSSPIDAQRRQLSRCFTAGQPEGTESGWQSGLNTGWLADFAQSSRPEHE